LVFDEDISDWSIRAGNAKKEGTEALEKKKNNHNPRAVFNNWIAFSLVSIYRGDDVDTICLQRDETPPQGIGRAVEALPPVPG